MKKIVVHPATRLEGHAKITILLNDEGNVDDVKFQQLELRGFEKFCIGKPVEELPRIVTSICGVCPWSHHLASAKANDAVFGVQIPPAGKKLRELCNSIAYCEEHILHFYFLGGPDFVVGPDALPAKRNVLGVIEKAGVEIGKEVIKHRAYGQKITAILGGKATHPVCGLPGGVSKGLSKEEIKDIESMTKSCVEFAKFSLKLFDDIVLKNKLKHYKIYNI